ncbi:MAG: zinc metalloprotease HtpX [Candidatus Micrarchaeia archaeon]
MKLELAIFLTTFLVFAVIAGILAIVLTFIGAKGSVILALVFSIILVGIQWYIGPVIVKLVSGAKVVDESQAPELHAMISELSNIAGIPKPQVCIVDNPTPNAFAFGRTQKSSYVAVHTGLLQRLNKNEVRSVLAHEIGHIKNRDVAAMTMASVLPVFLYYIFLMVGGNDRRDSILTFLGAVIAQFIGQLFVLWLSRQREYYADAYSSRLVKDPIPLARALVKISTDLQMAKDRGYKSEGIMNAFYFSEAEIVSDKIIDAIGMGKKEELKNILKKENTVLEIFNTHPSVLKRIRALLNVD